MKNENKPRKRAAKINQRTAETAAQLAESEGDRRRSRWILEGTPVLVAKDFSDPEYPDDAQPMAALKGEATRDIEELARQILFCCSSKKWTSYQKRIACEQLVELAFLSTESIYLLAKAFPEPFREIAEESSHFPCLYPAHADELPMLKSVLWDRLNLGRRHAFKLRGSQGRKTFSRKTWVNKLLIDLIGLAHKLADEEIDRDPGGKYSTSIRDVVVHVPLTRGNAKQWLEVIWKLLPNPENEPRLRQLVERPSLRQKRMRRDGTVSEKTQAHNIRASIKAKLGEYLRRMLSDSGCTQISTQFWEDS